MAETSLKGAILGMIPEQANIIIGSVINTDPLQIQLENNKKIILSSISTIIPEHLKDHATDARIIENGEEKDVRIEYKSGLRAGDKIHLLALQNGKKYYALGRV